MRIFGCAAMSARLVSHEACYTTFATCHRSAKLSGERDGVYALLGSDESVCAVGRCQQQSF